MSSETRNEEQGHNYEQVARPSLWSSCNDEEELMFEDSSEMPGGISPETAYELSDAMTPSRLPLSRGSIFFYGIGHMLNDLAAACWFTYLLVFLTDLGLSPKDAAIVMLVGQTADGLATLLVGRLIDTFGHYKRWHGFGSLFVAISFSSVFGGCVVCTFFPNHGRSLLVVSYSFFAAVFNCGWAATQVSHMSLVNCITSNPCSRVALNGCRTAFNMVANLGLYGIAFVVFSTIPIKGNLDVQLQFQWIAGVSITVGMCFVILFHLGIPEPRLFHTSHNKRSLSITKWSSWFRETLFYQISIVYTLVRLATNVSQALLPFFLINDLMLPQYSKASIPAVVYSASFVTSIVLQEIPWTGTRLKFAFGLGTFLWIICAFLFFIIWPSDITLVYLLALLMGIGNSLILVCATSMAGVLVSTKVSSCGFVYGSLSFMDKLSCGVALFFIEAWNDPSKVCSNPGKDDCQRSVVRWVLSVIPALCVCGAFVFTLFADLSEGDTPPSDYHQLDCEDPLLKSLIRSGEESSEYLRDSSDSDLFPKEQ